MVKTKGNQVSIGNPCEDTFCRRSNRSIDLSGKRFGRLLVVRDSGIRSNKKIMWKCVCECGIEKLVRSSHLTGNRTTSCGCSIKERGISMRIDKDRPRNSDRIYHVYQTMVQRCTNKNSTKYSSYGGRGISVCDRWLGKNGYAMFIADMGRPSDDNMQIDRIDNDGDYCPENCRWATREMQAINKRTTRYVVYDGETVLLRDLAHASGIPYKQLHKRIITRKWSIERAVKQPLRKHLSRS